MLTSVSPYNSAQIGQGWVLTYDTGEAVTVRSRVRSGSDDPLSLHERLINDLCRAHQNLMEDNELLAKHAHELADIPPAPVDPVYALKLHETLDTDEHTITRVPGGWIYWNIAASNSVFVPYNNEFQSKNHA